MQIDGQRLRSASVAGFFVLQNGCSVYALRRLGWWFLGCERWSYVVPMCEVGVLVFFWGGRLERMLCRVIGREGSGIGDIWAPLVVRGTKFYGYMDTSYEFKITRSLSIRVVYIKGARMNPGCSFIAYTLSSQKCPGTCVDLVAFSQPIKA